MKSLLITTVVVKAAEIIAKGELVGEVIEEISERTGDAANLLEAIEMSLPEVKNA